MLARKLLPNHDLENPFNKNKYPHCHDGWNYAVDVVKGKIPASVYTIGACIRSLNEIPDKENGMWIFDVERAEKYLRIVQQFEHVKGHWNQKKILYEPWQKFIWMNIQGFVNRYTGFRRFRFAHIEIARGNAKSAMASQAVLFELACDNPNGNKISTVATKTQQARIVLDDARAMAEKNKAYRNKLGVEVRAHNIIHPKSNSEVRALSSEAKSLDGLNDSLAVCDELHAMRKDVFEVITSGMSKRRDSLILAITTAGDDTESVGFSESVYAKRLCLGEIEDDTRFAIVYTLDKDDNIYEEKNWIKANPNFGVSVDPDTFRSKIHKTIETPADLPNFKVKHLNLWTEGAEAFFSMDRWDACANKSLRIEDFKGLKCKAAIDLSQVIDLASQVYIFKKDDKYVIFDKTYVAEAMIGHKDSSDKYPEWIAAGHLHKMKGEVISFEKFGDEVKNNSDIYKISQCAYDPWAAAEMAQRLSSKIEMVEYKMNTANLSEPMKRLDAFIREGKVMHNGSPLMRWCLANVVAKEDANSNVFPLKPHKKLKIDVAVAMIMAIALWIQDQEQGSVYETRGLRRI